MEKTLKLDRDKIRELVAQAVAKAIPSGESGVGSGGADSLGAYPPKKDQDASVVVAVGADHGGVELKDTIAAHLIDTGCQVFDCGTNGPDAVDYPDLAHAVAKRVADGSAAAGIVVDGAGIGSAMVANKVPGVRAALCYDISSARNSREHNHANVLTLGAGLIGRGLALQIVDAWLATPHGSGRHALRVAKIDDIERTYLARGSK